jgi:hypothetical protein
LAFAQTRQDRKERTRERDVSLVCGEVNVLVYTPGLDLEQKIRQFWMAKSEVIEEPILPVPESTVCPREHSRTLDKSDVPANWTSFASAPTGASAATSVILLVLVPRVGRSAPAALSAASHLLHEKDDSK